MENKQTILNNLAHFTGSESFYKTNIFTGKKLVHTDGVQYLAEAAESYWLLDIVTSYFADKKAARRLAQEGFASVRLVRREEGGAVFTMDDGNGNIFVTQEIEFTDFPLDEIHMFLELGSIDGVNPTWVLMLPSER